MKPAQALHKILRYAASFAAMLLLTVMFAQSGVAQQPAPAPGAAPQGGRGGGGGQRLTPGGTGPVRVLLITKGHAFTREPFFAMFDALGTDITWTHAEHPAADLLMRPDLATNFDVFVYYDMAGRSIATTGGAPRNYLAGIPATPRAGSTATVNDIEPSPELKANFAALLRTGKPMVFFHHALASWVHTWPEYTEVMGGACDWGRELITRGVTHTGTRSGFHQNTVQTITAVNPTHPIMRDLPATFEITDESYTCPMFENSVTPLARTSWQPADQAQHDRHLNPSWAHSNLFAWVKTAENSPIVYIQGGHDNTAWTNENFRKLMGNAIKWAASPEAAAWARANPSKIFP